MTEISNPYIDKWGAHWGYCNACGQDVELGQDCPDCDDGEIEPFDDDPDPDQ